MTDNDHLPAIFTLKIGANVLITIIGFLGGFILAYQYRAYISGELADVAQTTVPPHPSSTEPAANPNRTTSQPSSATKP